MDSFIEIWDLDQFGNYISKKTFGPMPTKEAYMLYDMLSHIKVQPDKDVVIRKVVIEMDLSGLNNAAKEMHTVAIEHGFNDPSLNVPSTLCLIHSEVSEAMEEDRIGGSMASELVDVLIRTLQFMYSMGYDIEREIKLKHNKNKNRPYMHGGKLY